MNCFHNKKLMVLFAVIVFSISAVSTSYSASSASDIIVDFSVVRTTSFVTMIVGTGVFLVTLPFTLIGGNVGDAGTKLVGNPARATFSRPLGDSDTMARWPFKYNYQVSPQM